MQGQGDGARAKWDTWRVRHGGQGTVKQTPVGSSVRKSMTHKHPWMDGWKEERMDGCHRVIHAWPYGMTRARGCLCGTDEGAVVVHLKMKASELLVERLRISLTLTRLRS